jgi:hypothetical protein
VFSGTSSLALSLVLKSTQIIWMGLISSTRDEQFADKSLGILGRK